MTFRVGPKGWREPALSEAEGNLLFSMGDC
jgi:hypothetical protein